MKPHKLIPLALAGLLTVSGASADAAVSIENVTYDENGASLSGTALLPTPGEQSVTEWASVARAALEPEVADALGIEMVDALIEPLDDGLRFIWQLKSLRPVFAPEGVRYTWGFALGSNLYQLQAKSSNLASVTTSEDPEGHLAQTATDGGFYQLRGRCLASYVPNGSPTGIPVSGCYHLAFLDGGYDDASARVWIDLPYGLEAAPEFVRGVEVTESQSAGMSIAASLQAVVSNAYVSTYINGWTPYLTAPRVHVASSASAGDPSLQLYSIAADLDEEAGTWTATLSNGQPGRHYSVRGCIGIGCVYDQVQG